MMSVRLYLVEDSPIIVRLLRELFDGTATLDVVGQSGKAPIAIEEIIGLAPDAIIVDIALENGSGFDVLRALLERRADYRPITFVLSNFATQRYRDEALRLGAHYFFDKNGEILGLLKAVISCSEGTLERNGSHG